jgi:uncharacterized protein YkuJ
VIGAVVWRRSHRLILCFGHCWFRRCFATIVLSAVAILLCCIRTLSLALSLSPGLVAPPPAQQPTTHYVLIACLSSRSSWTAAVPPLLHITVIPPHPAIMIDPRHHQTMTTTSTTKTTKKALVRAMLVVTASVFVLASFSLFIDQWGICLATRNMIDRQVWSDMVKTSGGHPVQQAQSWRLAVKAKNQNDPHHNDLSHNYNASSSSSSDLFLVKDQWLRHQHERKSKQWLLEQQTATATTATTNESRIVAWPEKPPPLQNEPTEEDAAAAVASFPDISIVGLFSSPQERQALEQGLLSWYPSSLRTVSSSFCQEPEENKDYYDSTDANSWESLSLEHKQQRQSRWNQLYQQRLQNNNTAGATTSVCTCTTDEAMIDVVWQYVYYMNQTAGKKFLLWLPDPADVLWKDFVMTQTYSFDDDINHKYRSPEFLHELLVAGPRNHQAMEIINKTKARYMQLPLLLNGTTIPPDHVFVVRPEELLLQQQSLPKVWQHLRAFLDLEPPSSSSTYNGIPNLPTSTQETDDDRNMMVMLPETREFAHILFQEEIDFIYRHYGINVRSSSTTSPPPPTSKEQQQNRKQQAIKMLAQQVQARTSPYPSTPFPYDKDARQKLASFGPNNIEPQQQQTYADKFMPDINIVGIPKGGTSQLYKILTQHPSLTRFNPISKETCAFLPYPLETTYIHLPTPHRQSIHTSIVQRLQTLTEDQRQTVTSKLQKYFEKKGMNIEKRRQQERRKKMRKRNPKNKGQQRQRQRTVNGCLYPEEVLMQYLYLGQPTNRKFIVVYRDPADWLWAAWNFWNTTTDTYPDEERVHTGWTNHPEDYRSPELFHELLLAAGSGCSNSGDSDVGGVHPMADYLDQRRAVFMNAAIQLGAVVPKENILLVRNEDMVPDRVAQPGGLLDQLSTFLSIDRKKFSSSTYAHFTNCNDNKGDQVACQKKTSSYAIAGYRSMLEEKSSGAQFTMVPLLGIMGGCLRGQVKQCNNKRYKIQFNKV